MDSSVDCHASTTALARNDRKERFHKKSAFFKKWILGKTILRVAVGLWVFFTNFGRELP